MPDNDGTSTTASTTSRPWRIGNQDVTTDKGYIDLGNIFDMTPKEPGSTGRANAQTGFSNSNQFSNQMNTQQPWNPVRINDLSVPNQNGNSRGKGQGFHNQNGNSNINFGVNNVNFQTPHNAADSAIPISSNAAQNTRGNPVGQLNNLNSNKIFFPNRPTNPNAMQWPNGQQPGHGPPHRHQPTVWLDNSDATLTNPNTPILVQPHPANNPKKQKNNAANWQEINNAPDIFSAQPIRNNNNNNNANNLLDINNPNFWNIDSTVNENNEKDVDIIQLVNNNLMASGMDIVKANLDSVHRELNEMPSVSRPSPQTWNPLAPSQFDPIRFEPLNNNDIHASSRTPIGGGFAQTHANVLLNPHFLETQRCSLVLGYKLSLLDLFAQIFANYFKYLS